jgi:hypothetical protein
VILDQDLRDGILVGEEWDEQLRWADAVGCVVTSAAVASMWRTAEVSVALSRGSRLLPVRAEPGVDHPLLRSVQYTDLTRDPITARAALVEQLAGLPRSPAERAEGAVLLAMGPSGCGKSSLVRAGLLSTMAGEPGWWTLPPILPGTDSATVA